MKKRYLTWIILSWFIMVCALNPLIHNTTVEADEINNLEGSAYNYWYAPEKSFGIEEVKTINFTFWKMWLKEYFGYKLEARVNNESSWQNANSLLNVSFLFNNTDKSCKVILTLNTTNAPRSLYYRFTLVANRSVISHINKSVDFQYTLLLNANLTENYSLIYNYSDLKPYIQNGKINIKQGIHNNYFYQRIRTNKQIAVNRVFIIDPVFGNNGTGVYARGLADDVVGSYFTATEDGVLTSCGAYMKSKTSNNKFSCAIYWESNNTLIGWTNQYNTFWGNYFKWQFFTWNQTIAIITGVTYILCIWGNSLDAQITDSNGVNSYKDDQSYNYPSFPSPFADVTLSDNTFCIYANYTVISTDNQSPVISNENPINNSININAGFNVNLIWNCTITDNSGTFDWTIECSYTGEINSSNSDANGSKQLTINDVEYLYTFTIWVNVTDGNNSVSEWFNFTAEDITVDEDDWLFYTGLNVEPEFLFLSIWFFIFFVWWKSESEDLTDYMAILFLPYTVFLCAVILPSYIAEIESDWRWLTYFIFIAIAIIVTVYSYEVIKRRKK